MCAKLSSSLYSFSFPSVFFIHPHIFPPHLPSCLISVPGHCTSYLFSPHLSLIALSSSLFIYTFSYSFSSFLLIFPCRLPISSSLLIFHPTSLPLLPFSSFSCSSSTVLPLSVLALHSPSRRLTASGYVVSFLTTPSPSFSSSYSSLSSSFLLLLPSPYRPSSSYFSSSSLHILLLFLSFSCSYSSS